MRRYQYRINWLNYRFIHEDGYGRFGMHMIRALTRLGVDVYPGVMGQLEMPGWLQRLGGLDFSRPTIMLMPGNMLRPVGGVVWGYTMHEDSSIPADWPEIIDDVCERLLVPSEHNAEAFKRRGVSVPIHVIPGGTCPQEFPLLPVDGRNGAKQPYTFLCLGDRGPRKGLETVWAAFYRAFPEQTDVRLVVKTRMGGMGFIRALNEPRVSIWREDVDNMTDVYALADCFVYPAYGDGWGMPPREAAMMGLPVIATRWSGLEDGIDHYALPLNKLTLQRSTLDTPDGMWARPDIDELAEQMRWCYEHPDEARHKGLTAAQWLREHQTWEHSARALIELMEKVL